MANISKFRVNGLEYDLKDATARASLDDLTVQIASLSGIPFVESTTDSMVNIRDMESGTYVFYGRFKPFAGSTGTLTFSSKLLVNVIKRTADSQVMVFYPVNNCVQYLKVTDDAYERKNVYLNDLMDTVEALETAVGDISTLETVAKTDLVSAVNELASSKQAIVTKTQAEYNALSAAGEIDPDTIYMIVRDDP